MKHQSLWILILVVIFFSKCTDSKRQEDTGDKLIHLQVSENYRGTPGTGQTRWDDYMRGLKAISDKPGRFRF